MQRALILASIIVFVLAAFGANPFGLALVPLGAALFAASYLV